ncbi:MAG TPA: hypothetical protein VMU33_10885 [Burkholderiaceae bacterium]|nr:hypothetical protein [Burkholderiaceae bacterium]
MIPDPQAVKSYAFNGVPGCVTQRRSRDTGTLIGLYHAAQASMSTEAGAWATVCEDHGTVVNHARLADARAWMAEPSIWCEACRAPRVADPRVPDDRQRAD